MAQNTTKIVPAGVWFQLTDANATNVTLHVNSVVGSVLLQPAVGAVTPTSESGSLRFNQHERIINTPLQNMFPGAGAVNRLYAFAANGAEIFISHA
jgi:hypothetical protein